MKQQKKSQQYYKALEKTFAALSSKSSEEFHQLLASQETSEVTNLLSEYSYANEIGACNAVALSVTAVAPLSMANVHYNTKIYVGSVTTTVSVNALTQVINESEGITWNLAA